MAKNFSDLWVQYFGDYTESYCLRNKLYVAYDINGKAQRWTKSIFDYGSEIINTDLNLIAVGMKVKSENKKLEEFINEKMRDDKLMETFGIFIVQGLVTGGSALKNGRDEFGNPKIDVALTENLSWVKDKNNYITQWKNEYYINLSTDKKETVKVTEIYTDEETIISIGEDIKVIPNRYGKKWLHFTHNRPHPKGEVIGIGETERFKEATDVINSALTQIFAILDIYGNPKFLAIGVNKTMSISKDVNIIKLMGGSDFKILEYSGNIIPSALAYVEKIEAHLKNNFPELILSDLGDLSGYALKLKLTKLEQKIKKYRERYFSAIHDALEIYLKMYGFENPEFEIEADEIIPADEDKLMDRLIELNSMDIVSKETIAERLGIDYEAEQEKLAKELMIYDRETTMAENTTINE